MLRRPATLLLGGKSILISLNDASDMEGHWGVDSSP